MMDRVPSVANLARQIMLLLRLFLLLRGLSAARTDLSMLPSAQTEMQQIIDAPMMERVAVGRRHAMLLNVERKPMNKVDENQMLNLLHESSRGLKAYCTGDDYLFAHDASALGLMF